MDGLKFAEHANCTQQQHLQRLWQPDQALTKQDRSVTTTALQGEPIDWDDVLAVLLKVRQHILRWYGLMLCCWTLLRWLSALACRVGCCLLLNAASAYAE